MKALVLTLFCLGLAARAGPYAPAAGQPGSTAIAANDPRIIAWGSAVGSVVRGPMDISDPESPLASFGNTNAVLGPANAFDASTGLPHTTPDTVLSLGDGGSITVLFAQPITDGPSWDFAVFENAFNDTFLELAFVEVSSDGVNFFRFPSHSLTQTGVQIDQAGEANAIDPTNIDGLAGKYRVGFGTPFDLAVLAGTPGLDVMRVTAVRIVDVVGSIDPPYARYDSAGRIINDPWPTPFHTGGFDLDAIGVLHAVPEPGVAALLAVGLAACAARRRRRQPKQREAPRASPRPVSCFLLPRSRAAFTLLELLIAVAIIAVLAALSLAVIREARARGDAAKCVGNLRQLAAAALAYAGENGGQYVPAQEPTNTIRWHGVRSSTGSRFDPARGPLAPYLGRDGRVKLCPALRRVLTGAQSFEDGTGGYGNDAVYVGGTPLDPFKPEFAANVPTASRVVMFADCAFPRASGLQEYAYAEPWRAVDYRGRLRGALAPSVHFRHGGTANVAWCDGHISAEKPSKLGGRNGYGGDATQWQIGWFGPEDDNGCWNPQRGQR